MIEALQKEVANHFPSREVGFDEGMSDLLQFTEVGASINGVSPDRFCEFKRELVHREEAAVS